MSKLLNKPLRAFTLYALVILALSIPVYYLVVDYIWLHELDEHNEIIRHRIENGFKTLNPAETPVDEALMVWNHIQPGVKITPAPVAEVRKDSLYEVIRPNPYSSTDASDRFRGLSAYFYIGRQPYHLLIETNVEETHETVLAIAMVTFFFFGLLVVGFIVLNRQIAGQIWRPFKNTLAQLKTFDLNNPGRLKPEHSDIEEFEELNAVLGKLIDNNIAVFSQQKQFTENASHELQTPLAVLKTRIDLLLQDKSLSPQQLEHISALNIPLSRVSRINKNLLLLAKIENLQYADRQATSLPQIINEAVEILTDYAAGKHLRILNMLQDAQLINGNRYLVEILITNLLVNAIRHSPPKGEISIDFINDTLCISNTGSEPLDEARLYRRFMAASEQTPGSGLGLAIIKEICNRHGWGIGYAFLHGRHQFSVSFA